MVATRLRLLPGDVRPREVRLAAAGLFGVAALWNVSPVHPPLDCPLRATTGVPCPFCGMTRACVAAVHGNLMKSLSFNPGGVFVLALAAVLLFRPALLQRMSVPLWAAIATLGLLWVWNIGFNPTFHQLLLR